MPSPSQQIHVVHPPVVRATTISSVHLIPETPLLDSEDALLLHQDHLELHRRLQGSVLAESTILHQRTFETVPSATNMDYPHSSTNTHSIDNIAPQVASINYSSQEHVGSKGVYI